MRTRGSPDTPGAPERLDLPKLIVGNALRARAQRSIRLQRGLWTFEALLFATLQLLSGVLPPDRASAAGRWLMRRLGPRMERSGHFARNVAIAFPEKSADEAASLVREIWGSVGAVFAEYAHLGAICRERTGQRIEITSATDLDVYRRRERSVILVAAHLSNWEIAPAAGVSTGIPLKFVYSPMQNPRLDRMLRRKRESLGLDLISKKQGIRAFVRQLQGGGSIGLLADQRSDRGELVPFFGAEMLTTVVPARLALRYDCDLVPVRVERLGGAHFRVAFHEPIRPDDEGADEPQKTLQMTRQVNELFEAWIREQPAEWFCSKRKWPKTATAATQS